MSHRDPSSLRKRAEYPRKGTRIFDFGFTIFDPQSRRKGTTTGRKIGDLGLVQHVAEEWSSQKAEAAGDFSTRSKPTASSASFQTSLRPVETAGANFVLFVFFCRMLPFEIGSIN
jgi:hypothetical protein